MMNPASNIKRTNQECALMREMLKSASESEYAMRFDHLLWEIFRRDEVRFSPPQPYDTDFTNRTNRAGMEAVSAFLDHFTKAIQLPAGSQASFFSHFSKAEQIQMIRAYEEPKEREHAEDVIGKISGIHRRTFMGLLVTALSLENFLLKLSRIHKAEAHLDNPLHPKFLMANANLNNDRQHLNELLNISHDAGLIHQQNKRIKAAVKKMEALDKQMKAEGLTTYQEARDEYNTASTHLAYSTLLATLLTVNAAYDVYVAQPKRLKPFMDERSRISSELHEKMHAAAVDFKEGADSYLQSRIYEHLHQQERGMSK